MKDAMWRVLQCIQHSLKGQKQLNGHYLGSLLNKQRVQAFDLGAMDQNKIY